MEWRKFSSLMGFSDENRTYGDEMDSWQKFFFCNDNDIHGRVMASVFLWRKNFVKKILITRPQTEIRAHVLWRVVHCFFVFHIFLLILTQIFLYRKWGNQSRLPTRQRGRGKARGRLYFPRTSSLSGANLGDIGYVQDFESADQLDWGDMF